MRIYRVHACVYCLTIIFRRAGTQSIPAEQLNVSTHVIIIFRTVPTSLINIGHLSKKWTHAITYRDDVFSNSSFRTFQWPHTKTVCEKQTEIIKSCTRPCRTYYHADLPCPAVRKLYCDHKNDNLRFVPLRQERHCEIDNVQYSRCNEIVNASLSTCVWSVLQNAKGGTHCPLRLEIIIEFVRFQR